MNRQPSPEALSLLPRLYRERSPLLPMIIAFNLAFLGAMHCSRRPAALADLLDSLPRRCWRVEARLAHLDPLGEPWFVDFTEPRRRLALLPSEALERLALFVGAALRSAWLAGLVQRDQVLAARQALGEEAYLFGLKRARFLLGDLPSAGQECCADEAVATGWRTLLDCFLCEPKSLLDRLRLKLPVGLEPRVALASADVLRSRDTAWRMASKILLKEAGPQWLPCFS